MIYSLKNNKRIRPRAPLTRCITRFLFIINRNSLQKVFCPLVLAYKRTLDLLPQQISNLFQSEIRLGITVSLKNNLISIQNIQNEKYVRLLQSKNEFKIPERHYINRNSVSKKEVSNIFTTAHNFVNQSCLLKSSSMRYREKPDMQCFHPLVSVIPAKESGISSKGHRAMHFMDNAVRKEYLEKLLVTTLNKKRVNNSEITQGFKRIQIKKNAGSISPKPILKFIKRINNKQETMPENQLLKTYKTYKDIENYNHVFLPQTSNKSLQKNTYIKSAPEVNRTVIPVLLDYRRKSTTALVQQQKGLTTNTKVPMQFDYRQKQRPSVIKKQGGLSKKTVASSPFIDIDRITEDVMRKINTKIRIERERRGLL